MIEDLSSPWLIGFLFLAGLILIWLEFFLPGGILGIIGGLCAIAGIVAVYYGFGAAWASVAAVATLLVIGIFLKFWMSNFQRTFFGSRMLNPDAVGEDEYLEGLHHLVGKRGVTTSQLRPSGKALIDGEKFDVVSQLGVVEKDTEIIVVKVDGISIVVQPTGLPG